MRPIVSQIGTPTAQVAAQINDIIVIYMPKKYMVKSTSEFLSIIRNLENSDDMMLASLDVESLFTNIQ